MKQYTLHTGNNCEVLKTFDNNSVDSIVTDPPYELGFMGKKWDASGIAYNVDLWKECLRVLKPGGHLLAFGGTRTYHRMTVAIEDAGFEVRDCIMWLYGSGFPKSHDVSKALDKVIGTQGKGFVSAGHDGRNAEMKQDLSFRSDYGYKYQPNTPLAQQWQGWGTALKPAHEPIVVARKPLQGTVADNVTTWGVGALNIDGCRIGYANDADKKIGQSSRISTSKGMAYYADDASDNFDRSNRDALTGRWPANIILDEEAAQMLDEQSEYSVSRQSIRKKAGLSVGNNYTLNNFQMNQDNIGGHSDSGGASRFFYVAKASKTEREVGLDGMPMIRESDRLKDDGVGGDNPRNRTNNPRINHHPTVKPISLMRYLVRMVTPNNGVVLDPFMGSGTTGCAAMLEAVRFIGIELNEEYSGIAERRIRYWLSTNMAKE